MLKKEDTTTTSISQKQIGSSCCWSREATNEGSIENPSCNAAFPTSLVQVSCLQQKHIPDCWRTEKSLPCMQSSASGKAVKNSEIGKERNSFYAVSIIRISIYHAATSIYNIDNNHNINTNQKYEEEQERQRQRRKKQLTEVKYCTYIFTDV